MDPSIADRFQKKRIQLRWDKKAVELDLPSDVFSSHQLDRGTALLIRRMGEADRKWARSLDMGCGYGPISIWLSVTGRSKQVTAVERDWLAAVYAQRNVERAGLNNVDVLPGLGYDQVQEANRESGYDLIVSNLPAKVGAKVHQSMLWGATRYLNPDGEVWIVVVKPLVEEVDEMLSIDGIEIFERFETSQHAVFGYRITGDLPEVEDAYFRGTHPFEFDGIYFQLDTLLNLPDFDTYSYETELLLGGLSQYLQDHTLQTLCVLNPTQGHVGAFAVARQSESIRRVTVLSRDALAIQATTRNLLNCGFDGEIQESHGIDFLEEDTDLIIGRLSEKEGADVATARIHQFRMAKGTGGIWVTCKRSFGDRMSKRLGKDGIRFAIRGKNQMYGLYEVIK